MSLSPVAAALLTHVCKLLLIVGFTQAAYPRSGWPWVFGIFFALIPQEWSQEVAWEYADRPLAVFLLAGIGCLALAARQRRQAWLLLAGLFWGAAGFCKDEGKAALVLLAIGATLATIWSLCGGGGRRALGNVALLALGLVPGLASLKLQHTYNPTPTKLIELMTIAPFRHEPHGGDCAIPWESARSSLVGMDVVGLRRGTGDSVAVAPAPGALAALGLSGGPASGLPGDLSAHAVTPGMAPRQCHAPTAVPDRPDLLPRCKLANSGGPSSN